MDIKCWKAPSPVSVPSTISSKRAMITALLISLPLALNVNGQVVGINSVVDLSHWNADVDFARAKADGIGGVMHKATQGLTYVDDKFARRKNEALIQDIRWGAYHFADGSSGVEQANHFLQVINL